MKVSDLMSDLETGDRSNEHLKKGVADGSLSQMAQLANAAGMNRLAQLGSFPSGAALAQQTYQGYTVQYQNAGQLNRFGSAY